MTTTEWRQIPPPLHFSASLNHSRSNHEENYSSGHRTFHFIFNPLAFPFWCIFHHTVLDSLLPSRPQKTPTSHPSWVGLQPCSSLTRDGGVWTKNRCDASVLWNWKWQSRKSRKLTCIPTAKPPPPLTPSISCGNYSTAPWWHKPTISDIAHLFPTVQ